MGNTTRKEITIEENIKVKKEDINYTVELTPKKIIQEKDEDNTVISNELREEDDNEEENYLERNYEEESYEDNEDEDDNEEICIPLCESGCVKKKLGVSVDINVFMAQDDVQDVQ